MKRLIQTLLLFVLTNLFYTASAQEYLLKGSVCDANEPLVGANIRLTNGKAKTFGGTTDLQGRFSITLPQGKYNLEISYIGYTSYTAYVEVNGNVTLPPITLNEDAQVMDAVVVTAKTVTYNASGYIAEISKNPFYREQDMTSILKLTPGTNATHDKIQVYGQTVSKVYLNGRELKLSGEQLMNYLSTLEGKNIKQMEVIAASGVEEDASTMGSSIIKITTINPETGGMLNIGDISQLYGDDGKYSHVPNVMLNWRLGNKWATYFNGNTAFFKSPTSNRTETHFYDTDIRLSNEQAGKTQLKGMYRALWGLSYDLDANNLFSVEASYINRNSITASQGITQRLTNGAFETMAEGNIDTQNKYWETNFSFMYTHKFKHNADLTFQADRLEKHTTATNDSRYTYQAGDETANNAWSDEKHLLYTARLDYTQRIKKGNGTFKAGVKYTNISDDQDTDYAYLLNGQKDNESSYTDLYNYTEEVYAAYAKYAFKVKKFDFNVGLRMEHALLFPRSSANPEGNRKSTHTDWAPEVGINYSINKEKGHNIALQYNRSIHRPDLNLLNPKIERTNEYSYSMGNPLLGSRASDRYSLRATFFNGYTLALSHSYTHDGIIHLPENVDGILYTTPQRGLKRSSYSAHLSAPLKLKQWGQFNPYIQYGYSKQSYKDNRNSSSKWTYGLSASFQLPKDLSINIDYADSTPSKTLYGKMDSNMMATVRISKSLLNRSLNVSLMFFDIFNNIGSLKQEYYYNDHYQFSKPTYHSFTFGVSARYTLRWGQKSMVRRGGSGNTEESSRLGE